MTAGRVLLCSQRLPLAQAVSGLGRRCSKYPAARSGQQKHLDHCAGREYLHDSARLGVDFGRRLPNVNARDFFDLSS